MKLIAIIGVLGTLIASCSVTKTSCIEQHFFDMEARAQCETLIERREQ
jgi:hypothetical protein